MPYAWVDPAVFMVHGDMVIYHAYEMYADEMSSFCYTISPYYDDTTASWGEEPNGPCIFDVTELPTFNATTDNMYDDELHRQAIRDAIDLNIITPQGVRKPEPAAVA